MNRILYLATDDLLYGIQVSVPECPNQLLTFTDVSEQRAKLDLLRCSQGFKGSEKRGEICEKRFMFISQLLTQ